MERAKIILGSVAGKAKREIAEKLGIARQTVRRWEKRFQQQGTKTKGLEDAPRSGRPRRIQPEQIAQIVQKTTQETPADSTHWSTRSLAAVVNVSPSSVARIWRSKKLKPYRVRTFKLSNDPKFAGKTEDIVPLYLYPPPNAVVVVGRRTMSAPSVESYPAQLALRTRPLRDPDPQLQAPRNHQFVRGDECA